jgi:hypothetical protein
MIVPSDARQNGNELLRRHEMWRWASHAKGFHLHVLLKPCVNLSIHTASDVRPPTFTNRQ